MKVKAFLRKTWLHTHYPSSPHWVLLLATPWVVPRVADHPEMHWWFWYANVAWVWHDRDIYLPWVVFFFCMLSNLHFKSLLSSLLVSSIDILVNTLLVCCSTWEFFKTRQSTIWERHPVGQSLVLSGLVAGAAGISSNVCLVGAFYLITLCDKRSLLIIVRNRSLI